MAGRNERGFPSLLVVTENAEIILTSSCTWPTIKTMTSTIGASRRAEATGLISWRKCANLMMRDDMIAGSFEIRTVK